MTTTEQTQTLVKQTFDLGAYGITVATLLQWLPHVAAIFSILWLSMQMIEKVVGKPLHEILKCFFDRFKFK